MRQISENVFCFGDTCNVYVIRNGGRAVLIDYGSGAVVSHLQDIGLSRVGAVLVTGHGGQGPRRCGAEREREYGGLEVFTLPTPGHTVGSVSYLVTVDGRRYAFTGDLVYGAGEVWSFAATQWTYTGVEGISATVHSCQPLLDEEPDVVLPSHGDPISDPPRRPRPAHRTPTPCSSAIRSRARSR